jgi:beta-1,4-mannosyltransferase
MAVVPKQRRRRRSPDSPPSTVTVLQTVPRPHERTNPFITQLAQSLPREVEIEWFSWRAALTSRYDVVHAHWPELALRAPNPLRRLAQRVLFTLWLARLHLRRTPVVRTLHNVDPHESGSRVERRLVRLFDARTTAWLRLNDLTPTPPGEYAVTIPHGHYIDWFAGRHLPAPQPGRLVYFGLIRRYKGVPELLQAFGEMRDDDLTLRIVGRSEDEAVRRQIAEAEATDRRISSMVDYVDDATLTREVGAAQLVVLPFRRLLNSGSLLLALSLGRPVLVPAGATAAELATEVGQDWVLRYDSPLTGETLADSLRRAQTALDSAAPPDLSERNWDRIGKALHAEYLRAVCPRPD